MHHLKLHIIQVGAWLTFMQDVIHILDAIEYSLRVNDYIYSIKKQIHYNFVKTIKIL